MIDKDKIIQTIKDGKAIIEYDPKWRYPHQDDTQKTCKMLQFMFDIEYKAGTLIFIPEEICPNRK